MMSMRAEVPMDGMLRRCWQRGVLVRSSKVAEIDATLSLIRIPTIYLPYFASAGNCRSARQMAIIAQNSFCPIRLAAHLLV